MIAFRECAEPRARMYLWFVFTYLRRAEEWAQQVAPATF